MTQKGYLIGEGVRQKLRATFARVEALPYHGGVTRIPVDLSDYPQQIQSHYLAKTTAAWAKGTSQTLTVYAGNPGSEAAVDGETIVAWNKFAAVGANKWVMLARCNGSFYLVAAEC